MNVRDVLLEIVRAPKQVLISFADRLASTAYQLAVCPIEDTRNMYSPCNQSVFMKQ